MASRLIGSELSGWQGALKAMAELPPSATPAAEAERQRCDDSRKQIIDLIGKLSARASDLEKSAAVNEERSELGAAAVSMGGALEQMTLVAKSLDSLTKDPALGQDCLGQLSQAQGHLLAMLQQMDACQGCVSVLASKS